MDFHHPGSCGITDIDINSRIEPITNASREPCRVWKLREHSAIPNCRTSSRLRVSQLGGYIMTHTSSCSLAFLPSCIVRFPFSFWSWRLWFGVWSCFFLLFSFRVCFVQPNTRSDLIHRVSAIGNWEKPGESRLNPKAFCFLFCFVFLVYQTRGLMLDLPRIPSCGGLGIGNWEKPVARRRL
jgi:hypothetical protein